MSHAVEEKTVSRVVQKAVKTSLFLAQTGFLGLSAQLELSGCNQ
ncbi:hypothetical protein [Ruegeria sp. A3M17]|nr:hypothetical protein [Ruegeria sp. A3M17]